MHEVLDEDWVDVASAIGQLRAQLAVARDSAVGEDLVFGLGKVEIELSVEARRETGGGGGVKFGVVSLEAKGTKSAGGSHKVRLELLPRGDIAVGDGSDRLPSR